MAYFEEALNDSTDDDQKSPIQRPLVRPLNKGVLDIVEAPGLIIIKYRFFPQEFSSHEDWAKTETKFD